MPGYFAWRLAADSGREEAAAMTDLSGMLGEW